MFELLLVTGCHSLVVVSHIKHITAVNLKEVDKAVSYMGLHYNNNLPNLPHNGKMDEILSVFKQIIDNEKRS
jgi:hypothetical protein